MLSVDYKFACDHGCLKEVITTWLRESEIPWGTRSNVLTDWRNRKNLLNISKCDMEPIDRRHHDHSLQSKYLEKVLFKL